MSDKTNKRLSVAMAVALGLGASASAAMAQDQSTGAEPTTLPAIDDSASANNGAAMAEPSMPETLESPANGDAMASEIAEADEDDMAPREGESLTEYEKRVLREQSRARQEKILWETRAEVAEARAKYEQAMADAKKAAKENKESGSDEELEEDRPQAGQLPGVPGNMPQNPNFGPNDGMNPNMMMGPNGQMMMGGQGSSFDGPDTMNEAESEMFLYSTYGRGDDLIAEVNYNGGVVRVEVGSNIGGWNVAEIKPTWALLKRDDKERELLMRDAPRDEEGGMGMDGQPNAAGIGEPIDPFGFQPGGML